MILGALTDTLIGQKIDYRIDNPIGIEGMPPVEQHPLFGLLAIGVAIGLLGARAAVLVRFRRSRGVERQQLKWFLYAVALTPAFPIFGSIPLVGGLLLGFVIIALPVAIGVAVLRYRLYEIDIIIRRTLIYGMLTVSLILVYFGSVVIFQGYFQVITGEKSQLASVISTLVIAALFSPLRRRLQQVIDRRFYRRRYDVEQTLASFSAKLRDEVDLDGLSEHIVVVVQETMQPESVFLWLKEPTKKGV